MIYPFLMLFCFLLLMFSTIFKHNKCAKALGFIFLAYCLMRLRLTFLIDHSALMASAAIIWAITARIVLRLDFATSGGILLTVALCYVWAAITGAVAEFGSPPFLLADCMAIIAMGLIGRNGIVDGFVSMHALVFGRGRNFIRFSSLNLAHKKDEEK